MMRVTSSEVYDVVAPNTQEFIPEDYTSVQRTCIFISRKLGQSQF